MVGAFLRLPGTGQAGETTCLSGATLAFIECSSYLPVAEVPPPSLVSSGFAVFASAPNNH